jgi:hypothetical protein
MLSARVIDCDDVRQTECLIQLDPIARIKTGQIQIQLEGLRD